jgi:hypothetical protein
MLAAIVNLKCSKILSFPMGVGMKAKKGNLLMLLAWAIGLQCFAGSARNSTVPGWFSAELPTLTALGFDWRITGDDNRNARVEVSYRQNGQTLWRPVLPFLRLHHERIGDLVGPGYPKPAASDGTGYVNPFHYVVPICFPEAF